MSLGSLGGVELLVDGEMIHFYRRQTAIVGLMEARQQEGLPHRPSQLLFYGRWCSQVSFVL